MSLKIKACITVWANQSKWTLVIYEYFVFVDSISDHHLRYIFPRASRWYIYYFLVQTICHCCSVMQIRGIYDIIKWMEIATTLELINLKGLLRSLFRKNIIHSACITNLPIIENNQLKRHVCFEYLSIRNVQFLVWCCKVSQDRCIE